MPQYEHLCTNPECPHSTVRFTDLRRFADMGAVPKCPDCGEPSRRCVVPSSPASFRMGGSK